MLKLLESERGSIVLCVPTMIVALLEAERFALHDLSSLRLVTLGGAPVPEDLIKRIENAVPARVAIGFGQTECSPYITHTLPDEPTQRGGQLVGRPLPNTEVKIVDMQSGRTLPVGEVGELCARGYSVMRGYFNDPGATAHAIDRDSWLHTGDLASMDEQGFCSIRGRLKDMIIRGGENIYPREIEDVLFAHPDVADVAVVGIPDDKWGELVGAFIRPTAGASPEVETLERYCREHLAPYKTPSYWQFVDAFPQTPSGKIQKFALRAQILADRTS
jgi:fatty-acyl-CoA synthase